MHASPAYVETQLEAFAGGQSAAFEQFYRDHHARIYNLAARIVGDPDDAADITQEVFLRAYTHPLQAGGDLRPEPWLYKIAVNASYDHLRRRAARPSTSLETVPEVADRSDGFIDGELAHCVETCLAGLTPRYRTALVLKDLHGLSHAEIAAVMDIHQGAARVLLHRARAAFRRAFRSASPSGAGGVSMLGLAAFLPELPVPASLQAPPAFANLIPQPAWPAPPAPDLAGPGQTGLSGAPAAIPVAAAPVASVPLAVAPAAPAGLLAGLGGAAGIKATLAVMAVVAATGGGLAARHSARDAASLDDATGRVRAGMTTSRVAQPLGEAKSYRRQIAEQFRVAGSYRGDRDGGGIATATRSGRGQGGDSTGGGATGGSATAAGTGENGNGESGTGGTGGGVGGDGGAGQDTSVNHGGTGGTGATSGGGSSGDGTTSGGGTTDGGTTGGGAGSGGGGAESGTGGGGG